MNPATLWPKLRTIGVVTLVTLLIWVWADAETQGGRGASDLLQAGGGSNTPASIEEAEFVVATLPVMLVMPAGSGKLEWERVRPQQTELKAVTIAGPRSVIDRLKRNDPTLKLSALLTIDEQDLAAASVSKSAELAPGSLGLRFVGPAPTVRATISR